MNPRVTHDSQQQRFIHCRYTAKYTYMGLLQWFKQGKEFTYNAGGTGDSSVIPGLGRSPGGGNGSPLQFSCLGNLTDRGAWESTVCKITKSKTRLNTDRWMDVAK